MIIIKKFNTKGNTNIAFTFFLMFRDILSFSFCFLELISENIDPIINITQWEYQIPLTQSPDNNCFIRKKMGRFLIINILVFFSFIEYRNQLSKFDYSKLIINDNARCIYYYCIFHKIYIYIT